MGNPVYILAIESSCDDTSAAVLCNERVLSNVVAGQQIHAQYGGVVPELASRSHLANIVPTVDIAIQQAKITKKMLHAVAFTQGPGLLGSLMVGAGFAKALALGLELPLISVNHMEAHIMAHFIRDSHILEKSTYPAFPFLCLTVSGGHTQLVLVKAPLQFEILGESLDDAAGEAFDKAAKLFGLPYPGGPHIDKLAEKGDPLKFQFAIPKIAGYDFSFSGLKTSLLYFIRKQEQNDPDFIAHNLADLAASYRKAIVDSLMQKIKYAVEQLKVKHVALAGGVSANSLLRRELITFGEEKNTEVWIPKLEYCTDNAAMIGITAYYKFLDNDFADQSISAQARIIWGQKN